MKKVTIEVEFEKFGTFGRTKCNADMDTYEEDFFCKETIDRVVKYVRKLFDNKNLFNPCVTFVYRDIETEPYSGRHYASRIFQLASNCEYDKIIWHESYIHADEESKIGKVTAKVIKELYLDAVNRALGKS